MRLFLSCQQELRPHPVPAYSFWEYYFKNALREEGHEVIEAPGVDWAEGITDLSKENRARWLEDTWAKTVDFLAAEHRRKRVDLFLGYLFPFQVLPSAVRAVRGLGIPCVNFFCDNIREFSRVPDSFADFDLHWVPEAEACALYAAQGLPHLHAPMAMWVRPELRTVPQSEEGDAVFIGSHDALREDLLGEAVGLGLELTVFGAGWRPGAGPSPPAAGSLARKLSNQVAFIGKEGVKGWLMRATYQLRRTRPDGWTPPAANEPLVGDAYFRKLRESKVSIGINRYPSFRRTFRNPHRYSRLRDVEAPMVGACLLTEMAPGLGDLYELGSEIETYSNAAELVEKSSRLLADPARRLAMRQRGQRRALADHTIARTLARIATQLDLPQ